MRRIGRRAGKGHLQLTGHPALVHDRDQIRPCRFRIRADIEIFSLFYAAERRAHDIAWIVSASASGHDADIQRLFHDVADRLHAEMMQLDGLTCRDMCQIHIMPATAVADKGQLLLAHHALIHAQPQHEMRLAALRIRTESAGKALELLDVDLAAHELLRFLAKLRDLFFQLLFQHFIHRYDPPLIQPILSAPDRSAHE